MADEEDLSPEEGGEAIIDAPEEEVLQDDGGEESAPPTLEDVASSMGWSPQDQWRGDPDKWKPAHEYVQNTADINSKLTSRLSGMEKRLDTMARTSAAVTEQALAKQRQELLEKRNEAFETGDAETFNKVDKELNELPQNVTVEQGPSETTQQWVEKNSSWFGRDGEATNWARSRAEELAKQGLGEQRQLTIVEREAKQLFPEFFDKPKAKPTPAPLSNPGKRGNSAPKAKTYANLPPEAKKAADEFAARGKCSKEQYAKTYFEQMEA